jgi:hypothetical protein
MAADRLNPVMQRIPESSDTDSGGIVGYLDTIGGPEIVG